MLELIILILVITILLVIVIALILVLRNGKFSLHIRTDKKRDVLLVETEHHDNELDK